MRNSFPVTLVPMKFTNSEFVLIENWLNDPETARLFDGRKRSLTSEEIGELYNPSDLKKHFFILRGKETEGLLSIFSFSPEQKERHGLKNPEEKVYGLDILIGDKAHRGRRTGTKAVEAALSIIFNRLNGTRAVLDTWVWHDAAVRCYENAGFSVTRILKNHDVYLGRPEDCIFMEIDRPAWETLVRSEENRN